MKILIVFSLLLWFKLLPEKINDFVSNKVEITYSLHSHFCFLFLLPPLPPTTHTPPPKINFMNTAGIVMQMFLYVEAGRFSFFQIFSFSKKLASSPKQLKSPVEYMVLGEVVSLSADGECRTPNSSPGLMASPPSLTRSQKRVRPAASTTGCNVDGFTFGQRTKGQVGHSAPSTAPSTRCQFL